MTNWSVYNCWKLYFANKGSFSQGYGFSCGHVWMWELDCKEIWAPKNTCFWTVVLEKILASPLNCKEIQPAHPKGDQSWVFLGRTDAEAETSILWPPHVKIDSLEKSHRVEHDWATFTSLQIWKYHFKNFYQIRLGHFYLLQSFPQNVDNCIGTE